MNYSLSCADQSAKKVLTIFRTIATITGLLLMTGTSLFYSQNQTLIYSFYALLFTTIIQVISQMSTMATERQSRTNWHHTSPKLIRKFKQEIAIIITLSIAISALMIYPI